MKDHLELSGHDEAIKYIEDIVRKERPLTETFIRELHKIILKSPYQVDAITPDGEAAKKWVRVGQYKTTPNHVKTQTGEIFYFATPEETPAKMNDLMNWFSESVEKDEIHPIILATEFHYRFIRIHPFDDGTGRIARLLMNFVLMQNGYPPAIIKTEDKGEYLKALEQADAGQLDFFFSYISELLIYSLELMIRAANGEEIDEVGDLDKKLKLLKKRVGNVANSTVKVKRNSNSIKNVLDKSINPLLNCLEKKLPEFDSFFKSRVSKIQYNSVIITNSDFQTGFNRIMNKYLKQVIENKAIINKIDFSSSFNGLINTNKDISLKGIYFSIVFYENVYEIKGVGIKKPINKLYDQFLDEDEILEIVRQLCDWQYNVLEDLINKTAN